MIRRLSAWLADGEKRARLFRWIWILSLVVLGLGYAIIVWRLLNP